MSLRIGVIGAGAMGADHVHTIESSVPAARVSEIFDADAGRARYVAQSVGASVASSAESLINSDEVDAVIICSPDFTHADLAKSCIEARKSVLCEKPLAVTAAESLDVVETEVKAGRQYVQVGFMRRYDPGYVDLRNALRNGDIGVPRLVHCLHRNAAAHPSATSEGIVTNSMIHELDTVRWLLDDEVTGIDVRSPIAEGFRDPQLATIEMRSGVLVSVEVFVNAAYGYDVRCEVVGTRGTASLVPPHGISLRRQGNDGVRVSDDFIARFADAYRLELGSWVHGALDGVVRGPNAWDGHLANVVAAAGVESLTTGERQAIAQTETPGLYAVHA
ncbi:MAG: Gfo/Idh/MocA family oxidoreductase [Actinomycetota bacterium]|nr:Gfo/Idh/MocA family oxidoreductase [Actinomycetota bacterium]